MRIPLLSTAPVSPERAAEKKGLAFPAGTRYTCPGFFAGVMELVDVADSKSAAGDSVPVRVRSPAPRRRGLRIVRDDVFFFKANVIAHSLRRSSFPTATHFVGLAVGVPPCGRLFHSYQDLHLFYQHRAACRALILLLLASKPQPLTRKGHAVSVRRQSRQRLRSRRAAVWVRRCAAAFFV